jgi:excisionase family DNA binding protein
MVSSQKGKPDSEPQLENPISLIEAAEQSGLSTGHLRKLLRNKEIQGKKFGRDWFTTKLAVEEYLSREHKPGPKPSKRKPDPK